MRIAYEPDYERLSPEMSGFNPRNKYRRLSFVAQLKMRPHLQVLTTPTADTPGTTLLLHYQNKRYLIGSLAEGTQRASLQMGAKLAKVSECFITGRTEWSNTGGLLGVILTLADASSAGHAAKLEEARKRAVAKAGNKGLEGAEAENFIAEATESIGGRDVLRLFGAPNLRHTLATARRFVFRKGMPVDVEEIEKDRIYDDAEGTWEPYWADENIKVWAMAIKPEEDAGQSNTQANGTVMSTVSPRKRSIDEVYEREPEANGVVVDGELSQKKKDAMTVKAVVAEMFDSAWRLDTLYETPIHSVQLPATLFVRNTGTGKIEKYAGPLPGGSQPVPNITVLVRRPWPGALVETLPPTEPSKEAISYIVRNHRQRGKFNPERAEALKVQPGKLRSKLSSGESVQNADGETITPEQVLGESKEGGGVAVVDLPGHAYVEALIKRPEWRQPEVMAGVGAIFWILGRGVATSEPLRNFMEEFSHLKHIVSSADHCPNRISLDSVTAATVRLSQVDPARYGVPLHDNDLVPKLRDGREVPVLDPLPEFAQRAARGLVVQLEPSLEVQTNQIVPPLDIDKVETAPVVINEAEAAQKAIQADNPRLEAWAKSLPEGARHAEIVTLGTGSASPSKYRNVSATLLRVPGWGSMLFDCGENTLGQLKRVFERSQLREVFKELRIIFISHMHADHHLGTTSVIKAWYEEVHQSQPNTEPMSFENYGTLFQTSRPLTVISEPKMSHWLHEYSSVEDYGFSHIAPLWISPAHLRDRVPSRLHWFNATADTGDSSIPDSGVAREDVSRLNTHVIPPSTLGLQDVQAVTVQHCHGARAISLTWPSGFKASYSGDCRPSKHFAQIGKGSTVLVHEATFDDELQGDAEAKNHSTTSEALNVASMMQARAVVLTHFSQRYQRVPVLESNGDSTIGHDYGDEAMLDEHELDEGAQPDMPTSLETQADMPMTTKTLAEGGPQGHAHGRRGSEQKQATIKLKVSSDMKVCVAFDYMRVKVGQIAEVEKFTPALLKLFKEEEKHEAVVVVGVVQGNGGAGAEKKGKAKSKRNN